MWVELGPKSTSDFKSEAPGYEAGSLLFFQIHTLPFSILFSNARNYAGCSSSTLFLALGTNAVPLIGSIGRKPENI